MSVFNGLVQSALLFVLEKFSNPVNKSSRFGESFEKPI